ncbi:hypothetical protein LTS10_004834 [Elasticomyces elasticus]|nr:hypothetical protein LTS10_004834 [Elasticomyces elasticus]
MASDGRPQVQEFEEQSDKAAGSPDERSHVTRNGVGAHKKCLKGDKVWLKYPDGTGPYPVEVEKAQFVAGTPDMEYRVKYKGQIVSYNGSEWFAQGCVFKDRPA